MLWYGRPMNSLTVSCIVVALSIVALAFRVIFDHHRKTIELLIKSNTESSGGLRESHEAMLAHLKDAAPIGGLPRELWLEQHQLKSRELALREQQFDVEAPLRKQALEHRLRKQGRLSGRGQLSNPEN